MGTWTPDPVDIGQLATQRARALEAQGQLTYAEARDMLHSILDALNALDDSTDLQVGSRIALRQRWQTLSDQVNAYGQGPDTDPCLVSDQIKQLSYDVGTQQNATDEGEAALDRYRGQFVDDVVQNAKDAASAASIGIGAAVVIGVALFLLLRKV